MFPKAQRPKRAQLPGVCFQSARIRKTFELIFWYFAVSQQVERQQKDFRMQTRKISIPVILLLPAFTIAVHARNSLLLDSKNGSSSRTFEISRPIEWTCRNRRKKLRNLSSTRIKRKFFVCQASGLKTTCTQCRIR